MADDLASGRFATVGEEDIQRLLDTKLSENTKRIIGCSVKTLCDYCKNRNILCNDLHQMPKVELNDFLRQFYAAARKPDGSLYMRNGLISLRYGLKKHFSKMCDCDIINDAEFSSSNELFSSVRQPEKNKEKAQHSINSQYHQMSLISCIPAMCFLRLIQLDCRIKCLLT